MSSDEEIIDPVAAEQRGVKREAAEDAPADGGASGASDDAASAKKARVEDEEKNHVCPNCAAAFGEAGSLTRHVRAVHEKRRDHKCPHCNSAFGQANNLTTHLRMMHSAAAEAKKKAMAIAARIAAEAKKKAHIAAEAKKKARIAAEAQKKARAEEKKAERYALKAEKEANAAFATAKRIAEGIAAEPGRTRSNTELASTFNARLLTQEQLVEVRHTTSPTSLMHLPHLLHPAPLTRTLPSRRLFRSSWLPTVRLGWSRSSNPRSTAAAAAAAGLSNSCWTKRCCRRSLLALRSTTTPPSAPALSASHSCLVFTDQPGQRRHVLLRE